MLTVRVIQLFDELVALLMFIQEIAEQIATTEDFVCFDEHVSSLISIATLLSRPFRSSGSLQNIRQPTEPTQILQKRLCLCQNRADESEANGFVCVFV